MAFPFPSPLSGKNHFFSVLFKFGIIRALILKSDPSWGGCRAVVSAEPCWVSGSIRPYLIGDLEPFIVCSHRNSLLGKIIASAIKYSDGL